MYTLILDGGRRFTGLTVDGSYFVSETEVTREMFSGWNGKYRVELEAGYSVETETEVEVEGKVEKWKHVDEVVGEYTGCELKDVFKGARRWYFAVGAVDLSKVESMRDRADIEYIAMKVGVEL